MVDWSRIENFSKKMEVWHNIFYKYVCIGVFVLFSYVVTVGIIGWSRLRIQVINEGDFLPEIIFLYDAIVNVGGPLLLIFMCYTILFTRFSFPFRFKGDGSGRKMKPPFARQ